MGQGHDARSVRSRLIRKASFEADVTGLAGYPASPVFVGVLAHCQQCSCAEHSATCVRPVLFEVCGEYILRIESGTIYGANNEGGGMAYQARIADGELAARLESSGAVLIEGPKACGKTETARRQAASEVRLDVDGQQRAAAEITPELVLDRPAPLLIDEWQLVP